MLSGVVQQAGADAPLVVILLQNVKILASLAALPEFGVVSQVLESYGTEAQFVVHFENCRTGGDAEYLGSGKKLSGETEDALLDALGKADEQPFDLIISSTRADDMMDIAEYAYNLAQAFSTFYNVCPIMNAESAELAASRLRLAKLVRDVLKLLLQLLGIEAPEVMLKAENQGE